MSAVLYWCDARCLTFKGRSQPEVVEEDLWACEEVMEDCGKWCHVVNDLYCLPDINRMIRSRNKMGGACGTYGVKKHMYKVLVEKPEKAST